MNDLVKNSIDSRKNALFNTYNITDQRLIEKIEDLFARINEFGEDCTDNMDFESKFATSQLNQEYIQLFTEIATTCKQVVREPQENTNVKSDEERMREEMESEIRYQVKDATLPFRRKVREETFHAALNTPIIGDIIGAKNQIDFFSRFKPKKKKDEEEEDVKDTKEDKKSEEDW